MRDRQVALDHHRESVTKGIAKQNAELEKTPEHNVDKRLGIRQKVKALEDQLAMIAEEQADVDRQKEHLARQEHQAKIALCLTARRNAQHEGVAVADKIRESLSVLSRLYGQWKEWQETDRRLKDSMRDDKSQLSNEVQLPEFAWVSAMDATFQQAVGQVINEAARSARELQRRTTA
jgi:hypothetical protein